MGMAPGAMLASAIVIEGGDVVARVLGGMDWAVGKGIKVLSMSLGFRGWWQDFLPLTVAGAECPAYICRRQRGPVDKPVSRELLASLVHWGG